MLVGALAWDCIAGVEVHVQHAAPIGALQPLGLYLLTADAQSCHWPLQMCVLDGKAYQTLQEAGREGILDDVLNCVLLANNQERQQPEDGSMKHCIISAVAATASYRCVHADMSTFGLCGHQGSLCSLVKPVCWPPSM